MVTASPTMGAHVTDRAEAKDLADQTLDAVIQQWAEAYDLVEPGDVITEYVIGLAAQNPMNERVSMSRYAWGMRHDAMTLHAVLGLIDITDQAARASCDEDE